MKKMSDSEKYYSGKTEQLSRAPGIQGPRRPPRSPYPHTAPGEKFYLKNRLKKCTIEKTLKNCNRNFRAENSRSENR